MADGSVPPPAQAVASISISATTQGTMKTRLKAYPLRNAPKYASIHATVPIGEYLIPLIGISPTATLENCDLCHNDMPLSQAIFTGRQILCRRCHAEP